MIKCKKCGHEWETKSKLKYVCCPSCLYKIKNKIEEEENDGVQQQEHKPEVRIDDDEIRNAI